MAITRPRPAPARRAVQPVKASANQRRRYPYWFIAPTAVIFGALFLLPTFASFFFSLTRWQLSSFQFIGLDNFVLFFQEPRLINGLIHTLVYGTITSGLKVVLGLPLAVLLTSRIVGRGFLRSVIFFPTLVSTVGVGLTFQVLMRPNGGIINNGLAALGIQGPGWLSDPNYALFSVAAVDVWQGVGLATVIYMAGVVAIPKEFYEAAAVDGATAWQNFWHITLPLARPATSTVIILSLIGGLRSFDLIWTMTHGGPGFTSDTIASVIYKEYQAGFYGLSTAGNVVLFLTVTIIVIPLYRFLNRRTVEL